MNLKTIISNLNFEEIKNYLKNNGSVCVTNLNNNKMLVEYVYLGDDNINSLELSPKQQFKQIKSNVWYYKHILPQGINSCYWLHKNCKKFKNELDERRENSLLKDDYAKNKLYVVNEKGEKGFAYNFILPFEIPENSKTLNSKKYTIKSEVLGEDREVIITLPKNYNLEKNYKCLVLSDGAMWKYSLNLEETLNTLAESGKIDEYIICYVIQKNRNKELVFNKKFCEFLCLELPKFLSEKKLIRDNNNLIFSGQSFGAITALCLEMYFPNVYKTIISQSASLWTDENNEILKYFKVHKIQSKLYYSYGKFEGWFIKDKGKKFKNIIKQNLHCKFKIFGGDHNFISWREDLIDALKSIKD